MANHFLDGFTKGANYTFLTVADELSPGDVAGIIGDVASVVATGAALASAATAAGTTFAVASSVAAAISALSGAFSLGYSVGEVINLVLDCRAFKQDMCEADGGVDAAADTGLDVRPDTASDAAADTNAHLDAEEVDAPPASCGQLGEACCDEGLLCKSSTLTCEASRCQLVKDCSNNEGGTAYLDECGTCVGETPARRRASTSCS